MHPLTLTLLEEPLSLLQGLSIPSGVVVAVQAVDVEHRETEAGHLRCNGGLARHPGHIMHPGPLAVVAAHIELSPQKRLLHPCRRQPFCRLLMKGGADAHGATRVEGEAHPLAEEQTSEFPINLATDHVVLGRLQPLASRIAIEGTHASPGWRRLQRAWRSHFGSSRASRAPAP